MRSNLIKGTDGKLYSLMDAVKGRRLEINPSTLVNYSYAPMSSLVKGTDGKIYDLIELLILRAEGKGPESLDEIITQLIQNTKELQEARGNSESLNERLKSDYEKMMGNINRQYLEFQGQGSLKAENCFNGTTKDFEIEGLTLQNLFKLDGFINNSDGGLGSNNLLKNMFSAGQYALINNTGRVAIYGVFAKDTNTWIREHRISKPTIITLSENEFIKNATGQNAASWTQSEADKELFKNALIVLKTSTLENYLNSLTYFEGIKSLGEDDKISILSTGKNLLKPPNEEKIVTGRNVPTTTITTDGRFILNGSSNGTGGRTLYKGEMPKITLKKGKKYILSGNDCSQISALWINKYSDDAPLFSHSVTYGYIPNEDVEVYFGINYKEQLYNNLVITPQLEENSITPYEAYKENKKDILLTSPLRGIPSGAKDTIKNKTITRNVGKFTFTGVEPFVTYSTPENGSDYISFTCDTPSVMPNRKATRNDICDKLKVLYSTMNIDEFIEPHPTMNNWVMIRVLKSKLSSLDVAGLKRWLQTNPVTVYYELAESIIEKIEDTNLETFKDVTHITISDSNHFPIEFKAKVPCDVPATISSLREKNNNLEIEKNELKENQGVLAGAMLSILEPMLLPTDESESIEYRELLEKLNEMKK